MRLREFLLVLSGVACVALWMSYSNRSRIQEESNPEPSLAVTVPRKASQQPSPTGATLTVTVTSRPPQLKGLEIEVECHSNQEFEVGYEGGEPVAFFMLNRENEASAIAGFVRDADTRVHSDCQAKPDWLEFSPKECKRTKELKFTLTSTSFSSPGNEGLLEHSDPTEYVQLEVFVWIDGGWRVSRLPLKPPRPKPGRQPYQESYGINPPEVLNCLYRMRLGANGKEGEKALKKP